MLKFTGKYTNGRETITYLGCTFVGHEPRDVPAEVAELLANHPEFERVNPVEQDANKAQPKPRRGRRPR